MCQRSRESSIFDRENPRYSYPRLLSSGQEGGGCGPSTTVDADLRTCVDGPSPASSLRQVFPVVNMESYVGSVFTVFPDYVCNQNEDDGRSTGSRDDFDNVERPQVECASSLSDQLTSHVELESSRPQAEYSSQNNNNGDPVQVVLASLRRHANFLLSSANSRHLRGARIYGKVENKRLHHKRRHMRRIARRLQKRCGYINDLRRNGNNLKQIKSMLSTSCRNFGIYFNPASVNVRPTPSIPSLLSLQTSVSVPTEQTTSDPDEDRWQQIKSDPDESPWQQTISDPDESPWQQTTSDPARNTWPLTSDGDENRWPLTTALIDDVVFVSETCVPEAEKRLAISLKLPRNYFAYKYSERNCLGHMDCDAENRRV